MLKSMVEYAVRGSRIRLGSRVVYQVEKKISLEISFESRGIVMDQERLSMLFKPYDYLQERLHGDARGVDIALMILRSNLLAMGTDSIIAETDEQKGTRISVAIPLPLADAPAKPVTSVEIPDFTGRHVLLVDDNEISMDVSEKLLISTGMQVTRACDGKEAAELFEKADGAYDLILMDVLMPVMDGLAYTRKIRNMKHIANAETIPIIALTVNAFRENFEESLQAGMNAHVVKPVRPENL